MTTGAASPDNVGSSGHMLPLERPDGIVAAAERALREIQPAPTRVTP